MAKYIRVDEVLHRELNILAAKKGTSKRAEADAAVSEHLNRENEKLDRAIKKGAA